MKPGEGQIDVYTKKGDCGHWKAKAVITWPDESYTELKVEECFASQEIAGNLCAKAAMNVIDQVAAGELDMKDFAADHETNPNLH